MPTNLPGGKLFAGFGGYINVYPAWVTVPTRLDVAEWKLKKTYLSKKCAHSGTQGAIARRHTGVDWKLNLKVWWDATNPPELLLQSGWTCGVELAIGSPEAWLGYGFTGQGYYASPSGILTEFETTNNSEGEDIVTQNLIIEGNSHIYLLPNEQASYDTYIAYLRYKGWLV